MTTAGLVGQAANDYALSRVGTHMPDSGLCLQFTRQNFEIGSLYYSAIDAWYGSDYRQPGDRNPPPAVPVWFDTPSVYGHVCHHIGGGVIVSTFNDEIRQYSSIDQVESVFAGPYMGWGPGLNEAQVWWPDTPPPATGGDDDVQVLIYTDGSQTWWLYNGQTKRKLAPDEPTQLADLGLITRDQLAAGPSWLPSPTVDAIPNA